MQDMTAARAARKPTVPRAKSSRRGALQVQAPPAAIMVDDWSDLSPEELAEIDAAYDRADQNLREGRCIPAREILPQLRRRG